ncbi:MAG TPA: VTC domain-containing protein [Polyangiaceae bacterium]|nr:VTC domain-containing protein [Polyangiaceae bacterium]
MTAAQSTTKLDVSEAITDERHEAKYAVATDKVGALAELLHGHLPSHRFTGVGANGLPGAHHFVTTIYFDTPSSKHLRAAVADAEHNVKVRAKEYYDLHPSLAEIATDPNQIVRYQPWLWFELKRHDGAQTQKRRFRLPKVDVPAFFDEGRLTGDARRMATEDPRGQSALDEISTYTSSLGEPLSAVALVNYRRLAWQAPEGALRITIDLGLTFYQAPSDLWTRRSALVRETLGTPAGREGHVVLEIKRRTATPAWLDDALTRCSARPLRHGKFVSARTAVMRSHG